MWLIQLDIIMLRSLIILCQGPLYQYSSWASLTSDQSNYAATNVSANIANNNINNPLGL